jgi:hypothetical protein
MDLFSYNSGNEHLKERALQGAAKHIPESGFTENWGEALRLDLDEASSISRALNSELYTVRDNKIWDMYEAGEIPDDVMEAFAVDGPDGHGTFKYNGLANWINSELGGSLLTDTDIEDSIREDLKMKRGLGEEVFNRANYWGKFGQFIGAAHAAMIDPALIPTYFIGIGAAAKGATWFSRFGRAAGVTAMAEGGLEALRQPIIYNWKKDIGVDYKFKDAMTQILAAGLGAGILSGSAAAVSGGLRKFIGKNTVKKSSDSSVAAENLGNTARELERAPDPNMDAAEHLQALETEVKRQQTRDITPAEKPIYDAEVEDAALKAEQDAPLTPEDVEADIVLEADDGTIVSKKYGKIVEEADEAATQQELALGCLGNR